MTNRESVIKLFACPIRTATNNWRREQNPEGDTKLAQQRGTDGSWNEYITALLLLVTKKIILDQRSFYEWKTRSALAAFVSLSCPFHVPIHSHYDNLHPPQQQRKRTWHSGVWTVADDLICFCGWQMSVGTAVLLLLVLVVIPGHYGAYFNYIPSAKYLQDN